MDENGALKRLKFIHNRLLNTIFHRDNKLSLLARFLLKSPCY